MAAKQVIGAFAILALAGCNQRPETLDDQRVSFVVSCINQTNQPDACSEAGERLFPRKPA